MEKAFKKGGVVYFICPGCKDVHGISVEPTNQNPNPWGWNGSLEKPTFTPSVLVRCGHYADGTPEEKCHICIRYKEEKKDRGFFCYRCHSFVTDGKIQFLDDSSHPLAGQTIDLPPWDHRWD